MSAPRRKSKPVFVGDVQIGGDAPVAVQSMCSTDTSDVAATVRQLHELKEAGCDVVRIAVPDRAAAEALPEIVRQKPTSTSTTAGRWRRSAPASTGCASTRATSVTPTR